MKKIALIFPRSTFLIDPMVYPPLGLWYLGAQIEAQGHITDFFDLSTDELPADGVYDQMWFSATSAQLHEVRRLGEIVRSWKKTVTILGGPGPWARGGDVYNSLGFDCVVIGEADQPEVCRDLLGIAKVDGGVSLTYKCSMPRDLLHVLPPIRRWSRRYHATLEGLPTTTMFTSRGCPMACAFCESGRNGVIWDAVVRYEPIELIHAQLKEIVDLKFKAVMFYDDILPLNKLRTHQILNALTAYDLKWRCFLRTDVIAKQGGYEYLREMRDAGLVEVLAGVESADNRIKNNVHKGTTIEQDTEALSWCKSLGIKFKASLILGLPGETRESMERTRDWILTHRPDRVDVNTLIPFPGTPIMSHPEQYDVKWTEDIPDSFWYKGPRDTSAPIVYTSSLTAQEIKQFHDELMVEIGAAGIPY